MRAKQLPLAGEVVDGRRVRPEVPNTSSIAASLNKFEVLPDLREVPIELFGLITPYSVSEYARTKKLSEEIKLSQELNPLIVVEDAEGFYVLEGGHRLAALQMLGARSFPAMVVIDLDSPPVA